MLYIHHGYTPSYRGTNRCFQVNTAEPVRGESVEILQYTLIYSTVLSTARLTRGCGMDMDMDMNNM